MRSGDAELDMRGRCSAGQKVLLMLELHIAHPGLLISDLFRDVACSYFKPPGITGSIV